MFSGQNHVISFGSTEQSAYGCDFAAGTLVAPRIFIEFNLKIVIFIALLLFHFVALAQDRGAPAGTKSIERGKYIVDQLAMCSECHTPRNDTGQLRLAEYLFGAPVPVSAPPYPNVKWALKAPAIAGLSGYTDEQGVRLLMEGLTTDGRTPNPPMPRYRMNRSDAEAVVAYTQVA
ncbi:MAG: hypothetical protein ACREP3_01570 [Candidatus Binatia bacterium]